MTQPFWHTDPFTIDNGWTSNRTGNWTRNATFWYTDGLAVDHGIRVGGVDNHRYEQSGQSNGSECE